MPPETTTAVTLGELSRKLDDVLDQVRRHPTDYVTRREWEMHQASWVAFRRTAEARRIPWTSVAALVVSGLVGAQSLGLIG